MRAVHFVCISVNGTGWSNASGSTWAAGGSDEEDAETEEAVLVVAVLLLVALPPAIAADAASAASMSLSASEPGIEGGGVWKGKEEEGKRERVGTATGCVELRDGQRTGDATTRTRALLPLQLYTVRGRQV